MMSRLVHRGPDQSGTFLGDSVALGHRRLSIIGVADGQQPIKNEDGSLVIVFNGEIYNYVELRDRLAAAGHRFATGSDTETIVHLYEEMGTEAFGELNGMFSLAIWDSRRRELVVARDRLGQKPLFYYSTAERVVFASELKAIVELDNIDRCVDPRAVDAYLTYLYIPHPLTIYRGISKLEPGGYATWRDGTWTAGRYWNPDFNEEDQLANERDWSERLSDLLRDAVRLRLQSEVPLGAFLSGGVDSSIVVGLMQELSATPVRTFSIGSPIEEFDETSYARSVARHLGVQHSEFVVEPNALEILPQLAWHYDEPFADSSAIPTWYVSKLTREHVTVALTGDGGDELFAGYDRYKALQVAQAIGRLPSPLRSALGSELWQRIPASPYKRSFRRRLKRFLAVVNQSPIDLYLALLSTFALESRLALYTDSFARRVAGYDSLEFIRDVTRRVAGRDLVTAATLTDLNTYLVCDLMTKVDIASMAHGLECRAPFLDYRVVELAARMPLKYKLRWGKTKRILIRTFKHLLPRDVRGRPKMGFGVPIAHWLRGPLSGFAREVLLDRRSTQRGVFETEGVSRMLEEHIGGREDHSGRLWALLVLELWQRNWIDR